MSDVDEAHDGTRKDILNAMSSTKAVVCENLKEMKIAMQSFLKWYVSFIDMSRKALGNTTNTTTTTTTTTTNTNTNTTTNTTTTTTTTTITMTTTTTTTTTITTTITITIITIEILKDYQEIPNFRKCVIEKGIIIINLTL